MNSTRFEKLTKKQTEVLREIATGNDASHHPATLKSLVEKGYISEYRQKFGDLGGYIRRYAVPVGVHIRWCEWCATLPDDEVEE
jgi:hypothetical protein